jgi:GDP-L-fucose synthase
MYVDDLADAVVFLMKHYSDEEHVNVGVGSDVTIREVAELIARVVGVESRLSFDPTKPDGMQRKLLNSAKLLAMGWRPGTPLDVGLRQTYEWYLSRAAAA